MCARTLRIAVRMAVIRRLQTAFARGADYAATWTAGAAVCYGAITVAGLDGISLLKWLTVDALLQQHASIDINGWSPALVNGVIALELNECLEWVRLPMVIATTPALSRMLAPYRGGAPAAAAAAAAAASAKAASGGGKAARTHSRRGG